MSVVYFIYLLSDNQFTAWRKTTLCDPGTSGIGVQWSAGSGTVHVTKADINWDPPADGKYYFLMETFSAKNVLIAVNLSSQGLRTSTVELYSTVFSTAVYSLTQAYTSEIVQQQQQAAAGATSSGLLLQIFAVVAIGVIGISGYLVVRRRKTN